MIMPFNPAAIDALRKQQSAATAYQGLHCKQLFDVGLDIRPRLDSLFRNIHKSQPILFIQTYRSNFVILNENTTTSRPSPYTTVSRPTPSIAVHNSFTINLVHRRTQQLHDQPRPSPYTTASRSTSSITIHNGFTIVLV
ncbi:hypothetical protein ACLKA7_004897 [Drosophila subpalustris]